MRWVPERKAGIEDGSKNCGTNGTKGRCCLLRGGSLGLSRGRVNPGAGFGCGKCARYLPDSPTDPSSGLELEGETTSVESSIHGCSPGNRYRGDVTEGPGTRYSQLRKASDCRGDTSDYLTLSSG